MLKQIMGAAAVGGALVLWPGTGQAYVLEDVERHCLDNANPPLIQAAWCRVLGAYAEDADHRKRALILEAVAHTHADQGALADDDFEALLDAHPDDAEVLVGWAESLAHRGFISDAIARYDRLLELKPNDAEYWLARGDLAYQAEDAKRALEDYTRAIEVAPRYAAAFAARGQLFLDQDNLPAAKADITQAGALEPSNADYMRRLGDVFYAEGLSREPLQMYRGALGLDPLNARAAFGAGRLMFELGTEEAQFQTALELLQLSVNRDPDNAVALFMLALTQTRLGQAEDARASLAAAVERRPYLGGFFKVLLQDAGFPVAEENARLDADVWNGLEGCAGKRCKLWE